jgi:hypothetical protein
VLLPARQLHLLPSPFFPLPTPEAESLLVFLSNCYHNGSKGIRKDSSSQSIWTLTPKSRSPSVSSRRRTERRCHRDYSGQSREANLLVLRASDGKVTNSLLFLLSFSSQPQRSYSIRKKRSLFTKRTSTADRAAKRTLQSTKKKIVTVQNASQK